MLVRTGSSLYLHRLGGVRGQLQCPLGLMDILETVRMRAWQSKDTEAVRFNPGAETLCLLSGPADLLAGRCGIKNASTF